MADGSSPSRSIPPAVANLYKDAARGDPQAQARVASVVQSAARGDRAAQAVKDHLDAIHGVALAAEQVPVDLARAQQQTRGGQHPAVRVIDHGRSGAFDRSFYQGVVLSDPLDRAYQAGQTIGLVRQAEVGTPVIPTNRPLAGAQQNNRGRTATIINSQTTSLDPNFTGSVASVVETPKDAGDDAETILVTLGLEWLRPSTAVQVQPGQNPADGIYAITANLTWGVGGASYSANIDWLNGITFAIGASFLRVGGTFQSRGGVSPPSALLSASLAYGHVPQRTSPTRLTTWLPVSQVSAQEIQIPRFASSFALGFPFAAGGVPPTVQVDVNTGLAASAPNFATLASYIYSTSTNQANQSENMFSLPNGAETIRLTYLGGDAGNAFWSGVVIWNLSL